MRTTWGSATDRGLSREQNEDALLACPPVFLVADGMGGHDAGAIASQLVVEEFASLTGRVAPTPDDVHEVFLQAAERLSVELAGSHAGTTVAGVAVTSVGASPYWLVFNIGDSRVYRSCDGVLEQITVDHSVVQELVDSGELEVGGMRGHPQRHVITRVLGTSGTPEPDYWLIPAGSHDRLLICSDGLSTELDAEVIARGLDRLNPPHEAAVWLVGQAVAAGGRDNVSVVVVDVVVGDDDDMDVTAPTSWERELHGQVGAGIAQGAGSDDGDEREADR